MVKQLSATRSIMSSRSRIEWMTLALIFWTGIASSESSHSCRYRTFTNPSTHLFDSQCNQFNQVQSNLCTMFTKDWISTHKMSDDGTAVKINAKSLNEEDKREIHFECIDVAGEVKEVKEIRGTNQEIIRQVICESDSKGQWSQITNAPQPSCTVIRSRPAFPTYLRFAAFVLSKMKSQHRQEDACVTFNRVDESPCLVPKEGIQKLTRTCPSGGALRIEATPVSSQLMRRYPTLLRRSDVHVQFYNTNVGGNSFKSTVCQQIRFGRWRRVVIDG